LLIPAKKQAIHQDGLVGEVLRGGGKTYFCAPWGCVS
jgi:hypothetical protein